MDWQAMSAISELFAATAVVASVIYLAVQVRSGARSTRAQLLLGLHTVGSQLQDEILINADLLKLFTQGCGGLDLCQEEKARFEMMLSRLFNNFELYFMLSREIQLPDDVTEALRRIITDRLRLPGVQQWWAARPATFSRDFVRWVDSLMHDSVSS
jgi:hypothetical protein